MAAKPKSRKTPNRRSRAARGLPASAVGFPAFPAGRGGARQAVFEL